MNKLPQQIFKVQDRKEVNLPRHIQYIYEVNYNNNDLILFVQTVKKHCLERIVNQYLIFPEHWKERNHKKLHRVGNIKIKNGYRKTFHYRIPFSTQHEYHELIVEAIREWDKNMEELKGK